MKTLDMLLAGAITLAVIAVILAQSSKSTDAIKSLGDSLASLVTKAVGPAQQGS